MRELFRLFLGEATDEDLLSILACASKFLHDMEDLDHRIRIYIEKSRIMVDGARRAIGAYARAGLSMPTRLRDAYSAVTFFLVLFASFDLAAIALDGISPAEERGIRGCAHYQEAWYKQEVLACPLLAALLEGEDEEDANAIRKFVLECARGRDFLLENPALAQDMSAPFTPAAADTLDIVDMSMCFAHTAAIKKFQDIVRAEEVPVDGQ